MMKSINGGRIKVAQFRGLKYGGAVSLSLFRACAAFICTKLKKFCT